MTERLTAFRSHQRFRSGDGNRPDRRIMHIDMDAYFAALEQMSNPKLVGRPVIVGSTGGKRGVVSTASYESRIYGITQGMSAAEARRLCPDAVFIGVDADHYISVSAELIKIFNDFSPRVEAVSVDEAFLDVTGCQGHLWKRRITRTRFERENSIIAWADMLDWNSTNKDHGEAGIVRFKPDGLTILNDEDLEPVLYPLPVEKMWGVGPVAAAAFQKLGVRTIGELARFDLKMLRRLMGQNGEVMGRIARGDDHSPVLSPIEQPEEKSIGHERTFPRDSADHEYLHATLNYLSDLVSRRMRRNGFQGRTITVRIRHADFTTLTRRATLRRASDCQAAIYHQAVRLFDSHWNGQERIRLLGISVSHLEHAGEAGCQRDLFTSPSESTGLDHIGVDGVVDKIRDRFGETAIERAFSHLGALD